MILPKPELLSQAAFNRLRAFAQGGGKVIFLGGTPRWIAGRTMRDARDATAADFRWATVLDSAQLPPTPTPPHFPGDAPQPQNAAPEVVTAIEAAAPPTVRLSTPDTSLRVMKRRWRDADVYLLFNESAQALNATITLSSAPGQTELWDPQTASITSVAPNNHSNEQLTLSFAPYATRVVVVREKPTASRNPKTIP